MQHIILPTNCEQQVLVNGCVIKHETADDAGKSLTVFFKFSFLFCFKAGSDGQKISWSKSVMLMTVTASRPSWHQTPNWQRLQWDVQCEWLIKITKRLPQLIKYVLVLMPAFPWPPKGTLQTLLPCPCLTARTPWSPPLGIQEVVARRLPSEARSSAADGCGRRWGGARLPIYMLNMNGGIKFCIHPLENGEMVGPSGWTGSFL